MSSFSPRSLGLRPYLEEELLQMKLASGPRDEAPWMIRVSLNPVRSVLIRDGRDTHTEGSPCGHRAEMAVTWPQAKGARSCQELAQAGRRLGAFGWSVALWHLDRGLLGSTSRTVSFCGLKATQWVAISYRGPRKHVAEALCPTSPCPGRSWPPHALGRFPHRGRVAIRLSVLPHAVSP